MNERIEKGNLFTCELCRRTFEANWSEDEAEAESESFFGKRPPEDLAVICDDCWLRVHPLRN